MTIKPPLKRWQFYLWNCTEESLAQTSSTESRLTLQTNVNSGANQTNASSLITKQSEFMLAGRERAPRADPPTSWWISHPDVWLRRVSFRSFAGDTVSSHQCHCINKGTVSARRYIMQVSPYPPFPLALCSWNPPAFNPHGNEGLFLCFRLEVGLRGLPYASACWPKASCLQFPYSCF